MTDKAKQIIDSIKQARDVFAAMELPMAERECTLSYDAAMTLVEELERVRQERKAAGVCTSCGAPRDVEGRLNGRHDGYNVLFSAIDEMPEKPCYTCVNRDWDMPQCRECNSTNNFHWYVKEET